ncbi:MAG TPA: hypothetical protein VGN72_00325 [Tepidisphaeraceae bacterium]|jgi:hypothetical protein|nr:hypothetical protein [Tepidisphaeraceae bacterium]
MSTNTVTRPAEALKLLQGDLGRYIPNTQRRVLTDLLRGEEREGIADTLIELAERIATMPKTYEQDGKGMDAVAHLHYFGPGRMNWWITEKDCDGGTEQAFGLADLFGDGGELGYIPICELVGSPVELDLYWTPKPLRECR